MLKKTITSYHITLFHPRKTTVNSLFGRMLFLIFFFSKLLIMKTRTSYCQKHIAFYCLSILLFLLTHFPAYDQQVKLKPSIYDKYIRTSSTVKVQTMEGQRIEEVKNAPANNIMIDSDKKSVIRYHDQITVLDKGNFNEAVLNVPKEEIRVVPELYVNPLSGQTEAHRIIFTLRQPFTYTAKVNKYLAKLEFLLVSESGENNANIQPVKIEVKSNELASINPGSFEINHLSLPSSSVELEADRLTDSVAVSVFTVSNTSGYSTFLKVKPRLDISSGSKTLQGFGVDETPITVRFIGSNAADSVLINFNTEKGKVTPNSKFIHFNQPATVMLRTGGTGTCKIVALGSSHESNELLIKFIFPWYFLIASILGGLAGSFIKPDQKSGKRFTPKKFLVGIITGLIGAAAYYFVGINLLGLNLQGPFTEIAVFVVSALFAYFGFKITGA